ncbi:hypothetical protein E2P81_ATG10965 [Venturia nashicola]|uniref:Uncharacterized protein n=1 Tax=Venturia nashicola TaxID=86259 RepID=A0A4Z1P9G5_9PEZI|nr:hypothetical protein E6O75_ATG10640 [Venturia nashicola]TLD27677.1 hypothetical protein E2P81_ATG10965 [Venturia nashicola]
MLAPISDPFTTPVIMKEKEEKLAMKLLKPGWWQSSAAWQRGTTIVDTSPASHMSVAQRANFKGRRPPTKGKSGIRHIHNPSLIVEACCVPKIQESPPEYLGDGISPDLLGH